MDYELLREWIRAEIYYALASNEEGADGYYCTARDDRDVADRLFEKMKEGE